jgi:hypothetical protein
MMGMQVFRRVHFMDGDFTTGAQVSQQAILCQ